MIDDDATIEEAFAAHKVFLNENPERRNDPTTPYGQWCGKRELAVCEKQYEHNPYMLLMAIRICANHDLPLPGWAAKAYIAAYDSVTNARAKSWDEVFGAPYPKGTNLAATRKRRVLKHAVWNEIHRIKKVNPDTPIDSHLFECIGAGFGIGKTLAEEFYYEVEREHKAFLGIK